MALQSPSAPSTGPAAADELAHALRQVGPARHQALVHLTERYPHHGPSWAALAEDHWGARRKEEAVHAARRALSLDSGLHGAMSPALQAVTRGLVPAAPRRERARSHAGGARPSRTSRGGDVRAELARAMHLSPHERRGKLNALSVTFPEYAPIWLALAEDHLADRRVEEAMACLSRALLLDPTLDAQMTPKLEAAYRYHDRRRPDLMTVARDKAGARPQITPGVSRVAKPARPSSTAPATSATSAPSAPARPGASVSARPGAAAPAREARDSARAEQQPTVIAKRRERRTETAEGGESIGNKLAQTLDVRDPIERLAALERLLDEAPDHPAVLFHFAIEAALASRHEDARKAGQRLQQISPRRYQQLYELAESYWPSRSGTPAPAPHSVSMTAQQKAELKTVMLNLGPPPMPAAAMAVAPVRHHAAEPPRRTLLLPVPASLPASPPMALPSSAALLAIPTTSIHTAGSQWTGLRTAMAIAGGIAAGLLVALALVMIVG